MTRYGLVLLLVAVILASACASHVQRRAPVNADGEPHADAAEQQADEGGKAGAAINALAPSAVAAYMDRQHHALQTRLGFEQVRTDLYITRIGEHAIRVGISGARYFDANSAALAAPTKMALRDLAKVLKQFEKTIVHVVGHTDSRGSAAYNQKLSERRARLVAAYLAKRGVNPARIMTWGRGESEPIASNETRAGRARNRRVDIVIKPLIEGHERQAFLPPPYLGA